MTERRSRREAVVDEPVQADDAVETQVADEAPAPETAASMSDETVATAPEPAPIEVAPDAAPATGEPADAAEPIAAAVAEPVEAEPAPARKPKGREAAPEPEAPARPSGPRGLRLRYQSEVIPALVKQFEYANPNMVPRLDKIVVNIGIGEALTNAKAIDAATSDLVQITGQRPIVMKARRSIAQFKPAFRRAQMKNIGGVGWHHWMAATSTHWLKPPDGSPTFSSRPALRHFRLKPLWEI